jgi:3-oxoacyl-[acyl-carrier protein] reductase
MFEVRAKNGPVDILVVNTGGPPPSTFMETSLDQWHSAFGNLVESAIQLIHGCLEAMCQRKWGRIIVVTSISAREPLDGLTLSNALRPALHGLVNSLSREVAARNVTINALMPGFTMTERLIELGFDAGTERIPAKRAGLPQEFAAIASFLASECASYITGQAIACDGGFTKFI